ncbi:MAG: class I SAM-dependent methyltransferase [Oligoflexia bacterium]|nr:class I SAM-dependent methyltransferase [Oligoflexia bacterium]
MKTNYLEANKKSWNQRTLIHKTSSFYDIDSFKKGKCSLQNLEIGEVGDVIGKKLIHLQCHFGQDTLSWARRGAVVTGIDFSPEAITTASELAVEMRDSFTHPPRFILAEVTKTLEKLSEQERGTFDIVFTSYGTITWLPDLRPWANVIFNLLRPGGFFYIAEFHPMLWIFDDDFKVPFYLYDNPIDSPLAIIQKGTYANPSAPIEFMEYSWNHSLSTIINALTEQGLKIELFHEHMSSPFNIFPRPVIIEYDSTLRQKGYQIEGLENRVPMIFSLKARRL